MLAALSALISLGCTLEPVMFEPAPPTPDSTLGAAVADASRAEEWYFADNNRYTTSLETSPYRLTVLPRVVIDVIWASSAAYALVARDPRYPRRVCIYASEPVALEALWQANIAPAFTGLATACMFPWTIQCFDIAEPAG